jgi:hypothetical protein
VRLAYFHPDRLLTGLYKQETEILGSKDHGNINKQTDIDRHGQDQEPSLNSSQPPVPPPFSLPTTFKNHLIDNLSSTVVFVKAYCPSCNHLLLNQI